MGLPVHHFIAATNINDIVPHYLNTGNYEPKPSIATISNAMDVGNPSNFTRMVDLYGSTWNNLKKDISGFSYSDESTGLGIKEVYDRFSYTIDPHGAVGYLAFKDYLKDNSESLGIILETAHPSKFIDVVEPIINTTVDIPERLASLANKEKVATFLEKDFAPFKDWLLGNYL